MKLRVDVAGDKATVRGKVWKKDDAEPAEWTITLEDPIGVTRGRARDLRRFRDRPLLGQPHGEGERMKRIADLAVLVAPRACRGAVCRRPAARGRRRRSAPCSATPSTATWSPPRRACPRDWDVKTGKNVKWWADVGSQAYAGPVVLGGKVFVGTNNDGLRNPKLTKDRGVVMAFDAENGELPLADDPREAARGPRQRLAAAGHLLHALRGGQPALLHVEPRHHRQPRHRGLPRRRERRRRRTRRSTTEIDGDVVWEYDMIKELDVFPHNLAVSSPAGGGRRPLRHHRQRRGRGPHQHPLPRRAPSFVAVDAKTGELLWENNMPGDKIFHGTWSNPTYGVVKGRAAGHLPRRRRLDLQLRAQDGQAALEVQRQPGGREVRPGRPRHRQRGHRHAPSSATDKVYFGVGQDPEHGEGIGNFWCIDATLDGDITGKGVVWHRGGNDFHRTISTVAIHDGIVYASDLSGFLYALDAQHRASTTGPTTCWPRSGARPSWPTAASTSATRTATSRC